MRPPAPWIPGVGGCLERFCSRYRGCPTEPVRWRCFSFVRRPTDHRLPITAGLVLLVRGRVKRGVLHSRVRKSKTGQQVAIHAACIPHAICKWWLLYIYCVVLVDLQTPGTFWWSIVCVFVDCPNSLPDRVALHSCSRKARLKNVRYRC